MIKYHIKNDDIRCQVLSYQFYSNIENLVLCGQVSENCILS